MSLLLVDGCDDGISVYKWTVFGSSTTTAQFRTGTSSMLVNGGAPGLQYNLAVADRHTTLIFGAAFRVTNTTGGLTGNGNFLNFIGESNVSHINIIRNADHSFTVKRGATTILTTGPGLFTVGAWYFLEAKVVIDDTVGSVVLRVNGVVVGTFSGDTRNGGADALVYLLQINNGDGSAVNAIHLDDIYILNGAGAVNSDFIGDCSIYTLYPNGNGALSQFVGSDGNSVDNYLLVDEPGTPDTADYVGSGVDGNIDTYAFADVATGSVLGVSHSSYVAKSDTGSRTLRQVTRIAAANYVGADQGLGTTYAAVRRVMEVSPATGVAWTLAELNGAEFGIEARP
jgi:hypothetical protein